jgi:uncharacterized protein (DUF362 family)
MNPSRPLNRRQVVVGGALTGAAGLVALPLLRRLSRRREAVFVARNQRYDGPLARTIEDGLIATGLDPARLRGMRVLLKPNLVEPARYAPHVTTHPNLVAAAAEVFRSWGAEVWVGEGPGHVRDTEMALLEGRLQHTLDTLQLPFADLNYEDVRWVANAGRASSLDGFYFPRTVLEADLIVSMPKMKTHHWVGVTASLKNMYGVIPGIKYGWPKNVLHHAGIPQTVFDINASLPKTIAIVDGIECMEGDGPIMGTAKSMGLLVIGTNPTAVDATVCRLMQVDPAAVGYLQLAADRLGPIDNCLIAQHGESWRPLAARFELLDEPHLRGLRCARWSRAT